jgi:hypothetical protein
MTSLDPAKRVTLRVQAPANAAFAHIMIRRLGTDGVTNCYLFVTGVVFGRSVPTLTAAFKPWGTSPTVINGQGIATNSITANEINVVTLSAINANMGAITAGSMTFTLANKNLYGATLIKFDTGSDGAIEFWD